MSGVQVHDAAVMSGAMVGKGTATATGSSTTLAQTAKRYWLALLAATLVVLVVVYYAIALTAGNLLRSGSAPLQVIAIIAAACSILAALYPLFKRNGTLSGAKLAWLQVHLVVGSLATALALVHWSTGMSVAPVLVLLALVGLFVTGLFGRLISAQVAPLRFAARPDLFSGPMEPGPLHGDLQKVLARKATLVPLLDPSTPEGEFSLRPGHWVRHVVLAARYQRLALREERLVQAVRGDRASWLVYLGRWWRVAHIALALLMIVGLLAHVVTVEMFADYAGGGDPYWWYIRR